MSNQDQQLTPFNPRLCVIGRWALIVLSLYWWVLTPIVILGLIPIVGLNLSASYGWMFATFGLISATFDLEGLSRQELVFYCLDVASPLIAFGAAFGCMRLFGIDARWLKQFLIYFAIILATSVKAVVQDDAGVDVPMLLAGLSGAFLASSRSPKVVKNA